MEDLWPVIGFIIYIVIQLAAGALGDRKKKRSTGGPVEETPQSGKSIFDELERQFRELEKQVDPLGNTEEKKSGSTIESSEEDYQSPGQEYRPLSDDMDTLTQYQPLSSEILEAPYSNLEKGIIDDVHRSKFAHHRGSELEPAIVHREENVNLFKDVSPKQAFVYSLLFDRKYFDI